jgi:alkylhydroperoxidase family enzyme
MSIDGSAASMEWRECWLAEGDPPPDLVAQVKQATGGMVPTWTYRLAPVPWVVRALAGTNQARFAAMPPELFGLIAFVVSQDNSCRYCYGATRAILKITGYADDVIDRIERDVQLADVSLASLTALRFARKLSQANPRPDAADLATLVSVGFSQPAIAEIAYAAAIMCFANRLSTLFALPPEALVRWVDNPIVRLLRPLIARKFRDKPFPSASLPAPNDPPCDAVIAGLAGSPAAHVVRGAVDDALASPVLPLRTKLLVFAVVGRALGCAHTERDARSGLARAGLGPSEVDEILANLGSPALDAREQALVPFARETVRYRNGVIQERTRALVDRLSIAEVIEGVAVASLANTIARLSVILDAC